MSRDPYELLQNFNERWNSLSITNYFVFGKVMLNEDICRTVLEAILKVPIERIEYIAREETDDVSPDTKGVRLDAYVRDGNGTVYDVEMQATNTHELPQRSRYYQAMLSFGQLAKGRPYRSLKDSYVIFICDFDLFRQGRRVYTFEYRERRDARLRLGDGTHTIFLAATSPTEPEQGERVNEFLDYVSQGRVSGELSSKLQRAVSSVLDNEQWRLEYMLQEVRDQLNVDKGRKLGFDEGHDKGLEEGREAGLKEGRNLGLEEGREEGLREGHDKGLEEGRKAGLREGLSKGESRFAALATRLIQDGRADDVARAAANISFRQQLYEHYRLTE